MQAAASSSIHFSTSAVDTETVKRSTVILVPTQANNYNTVVIEQIYTPEQVDTAELKASAIV